jgi:CheY-like chemotaxis protein
MIPPKQGNTDVGTAWGVGTSMLPELLLNGKQVLIADDCVVSRFAAGSMLKRQGAVVFEANDGAQALQIASNLVLNLILIDLQMPTIDGLQVIRMLRANGSKVPVIAITSSINATIQHNCEVVGINEVLPKPFTSQTLISRVIHCIDTGAGISSEFVIPTQEYITQQLKRLSGGDGAFARRMLDIIRREIPVAARQMREATTLSDWEAVGRLAHRMRPCITSLRMDDMLNELSMIEDLVMTGSNEQALQQMVPSLASRIDALMEQLDITL